MDIRPLPAILILVISVTSCVTTKPRAKDIEALQRLIGTSAVACPDRSECLCVEYQSTREDLLPPLRFTRSELCPTSVRGRFLLTNWDKQNRKIEETHFANGEMNGKWTSWHPNGVRSGEGSWSHGKQQGAQIGWHENGTKAEESYYSNGSREGHFMLWYDNGNVRVDGQYLRDKPDGLWIFYEKDGRIRFRKTYVRGELVKTEPGR